jgi:bile acid:Na+ symporter, BASS family
MEPFVDAAIPIVTFLMMVAVGHGLTASDLGRSATDLRVLVTATLGQLLILPLIATVIVLVFNPPPAIIAGLILVAACPGGTISNFYTCLANANSALSLTLTAISCLLSFVTLPFLVATGFFFWLDDQPNVEVPIMVLVIQLLLLVALPTCLGMILRRWRSAATGTRDLVLRRVSLIALVALVAYIVYDQRGAITSALGELMLASVVFTALAMAAGYSLGWATGRPPADRLTYLIEFPCRNLALALVVAVTILDRPEFAAFATVLLLIQALVILSMVAFLRRERVPS